MLAHVDDDGRADEAEAEAVRRLSRSLQPTPMFRFDLHYGQANS
jgi:hypothetical protein